ncbi:MAG: helix-turn-helix transcriptional regulator, partial [Prevotella sp.]|nr:helix-turn-helix transcriptional regulator [Prevotella sp.]
AIRWETLDADMHISSFYETTEPNPQNEVAAMFNRFPWLNVSEVARAIGINKSLLARYIYGISKPSEQRVQQIREAFHSFGRELQSA